MGTKRSETTGNPQVTIKATDLRQAIERVRFATTDEKRRFLLNVVRFSSDGSSLRLDATDGKRASSARIEAELPTFEFLVSIPDCKSLKKMCGRKRDTITISVASCCRKLTFTSSSGDSVTITNDPKAKGGSFAPIEHIFAIEPNGTIPILDPVEFERGVKLAVTARRDGERVPTQDANGNVIHITATARRTTVFGRSRRNGNQVVTYLDSDEKATPVSLRVNGAYLLELLRVLPRSEPFELRTWKNWMNGIAFISENFSHYLCGMRVRKSA